MARNRIRELREARGWTQEYLGKLIGRSKYIIGRLEDGTTPLKVDVARKLAEALDVALPDLLTGPMVQDFQEEAAPYTSPDEGQLMRAMRRRNMEPWTIKSDSLDRLGIKPGDMRIFDHSQAAVDNVKTGDVVVVQLYDRADPMKATTVIRQFVAPDLIVTNRAGVNIAVTLDNANFEGVIKGVMVQDDEAEHH